MWNFNKQSQKTLNEDIYSTYKKLFELNPESYFDYFETVMGFEDEKQINIGRASVYIISGINISDTNIVNSDVILILILILFSIFTFRFTCIRNIIYIFVLIPE